MRVRISYAVDSEELPHEALRLIKRANRHAQSIKLAVVDTESDIAEKGLRPPQIDSILEIRDEMVKLDAYLADIAQMILGHQQIKLQGSAERGNMQPSDPEEQESVEDHGGEYGELLQKVGRISESISEINEGVDSE